jgi:hypothetical protein
LGGRKQGGKARLKSKKTKGNSTRSVDHASAGRQSKDNEELTQRYTEKAQRYTELRKAEVKNVFKSPSGDLGARN